MFPAAFPRCVLLDSRAMTDHTIAAPAPGAAPLKPAHIKEFTPRSIIVAVLVAAIIGGSYPYIVMKLGFGPNISVVSAFFGFLMLGLVFKDFNRWENNIVQTAGTSAGQTAFLCVLMAAFDMLAQDGTMQFHLQPMQAFIWLTISGLLGVLLAVPMRQHFIVDEQLTFADGVAAAETLVVLDSRGSEGSAAARAMGFGTLFSALVMTLREDARVIAAAWYRIPEVLPFGELGAKMNFGMSWSLLSLGSGMLVGMRVNASMLAGTLLSWSVLPPLLLQYGGIDELVRKKVLLWVMWPATGMLVAGGLTALFLRWRIMVNTFRNLSARSDGDSEFPMSWVLGGSVALLVVLAVFQYVSLHMPVWMTLVATAFSLILMLVSLRVLGETNWGPISSMSNMMQAIFGVLAPGQVLPNLTASGITGSIASQSEGLMQDYKTGYLIGSTPKYLTYAQLIAVPVGAAAVSYVYPLLRDTYGIGGEHGLSSPTSTRWAGFAKLLSAGFHALPHGAVEALVIGTVAGILLTLLENTRLRKWTPSPAGFGIGIPSSVRTMCSRGWRTTCAAVGRSRSHDAG